MRSLRLYCLVPTLQLVAHTYLAPILSSISLRLLPPGPFDQLHSNSHRGATHLHTAVSSICFVCCLALFVTVSQVLSIFLSSGNPR